MRSAAWGWAARAIGAIGAIGYARSVRSLLCTCDEKSSSPASHQRTNMSGAALRYRKGSIPYCLLARLAEPRRRRAVIMRLRVLMILLMALIMRLRVLIMLLRVVIMLLRVQIKLPWLAM